MARSLHHAVRETGSARRIPSLVITIESMAHGAVTRSSTALSARLFTRRRMGYKAKQGVVIFEPCSSQGLRKSKINMKRKPSKMGMLKITMAKSIKRIAEERVARKFPNLEVLNSYWVEKMVNKFFEIILIDPSHPSIQNDKQLVDYKELTHRSSIPWQDQWQSGWSHNKGKGAEKLRPSSRPT